MTLDEAISNLIETGEKDPLTIARKIEQRQGSDWLASELLSLAEDLIVQRASSRLNARRRADVVAIRPGAAMVKAELGLETLWVPNLLAPGVGARKPMNECTPEDFDAAAAYREAKALTVLRHAGWFREMAARMRAQGADTFADYRGELPELPAPDESEAA